MSSISLLRGVPADEALEPVAAALSREYAKILDEHGWKIIQYAHPDYSDFNGFKPLKRTLAERFGAQGNAEERVICSNGGMETFSMLLKSLPPGSNVGTDALTYDRVLSDINQLGHRAVGVAMSEEGADLDALEEAARGDLQLFYQVGYHHNPIGLTTSNSNLEEASRICAANDVLHVVDIAYVELRYDGQENELIDLNKFPETTCVVGSFTKTLSPGAKCGFGIFPADVLNKMTPVIGNTRLNPNYPTQAAINNLIESGFYDKHLTYLKDLYRTRMEAVNRAINAELPELDVPELTGGFFLGVWLPGIEDKKGFVEALKAKGVILAPPSVFAPGVQEKAEKEKGAFFRLTFPALSPEENEKGIALLAETYRDVRG